MAPDDPIRDNIPSDDELDEILNGMVDGQDIFDTSNIQAQKAPQPHRNNVTTATSDIGIEKEIEIVKKRKPIPKLDDNKLLSAEGIPRLCRISKERLRFKGKGHEYGDIARMLNMYQLWLDDLYPRAKFADGLAMIEKVGHSKRIQYMRKEWIDEAKQKNITEQVPGDGERALERTENRNDDQTENIPVDTIEDPGQDRQKQEAPLRLQEDSVNGGDEPSEDELDALLAEGGAPKASLTSATLPPRIVNMEDDMFADEMQAMAEMEGMF
ncbi:Swi3-domain-containing protein [Lojkania enalia]|uniref:Chromosome segregation in meiosis protein n=1 Tax=Lojkania enalia TaxID=147567 RepID=A0A9P4KFX4_9PLEO|nr:Swi3-domain-containing protein [Didymosphaeria enalia]